VRPNLGGLARVLNAAWIVVVALFMLVPVIVVIPTSLNTLPTLALPTAGISFQWYAKMLADTTYTQPFVLSLLIALAASAIALVTGTAAAIALVRFRLPGGELWSAALMSPVLFPSIVLGVALVLFFSQLHLIRSPIGLCIAFAALTLPYALRTVTASLQAVDVRLEEAAATLGAGPWQTFGHVTLPLIRPGLIAAAIFCLLVAFDEFTVALFLAGPNAMTLPVQMFQSIQFAIEPTVAAISTVLVLLTTVMIIIAERIVGIERFIGIQHASSTRSQL
jgi:putative spermidine/putrescine transport system permease protein